MSYQKDRAIGFPINKNIEIASPKVHTIFLVFSLFDKINIYKYYDLKFKLRL